jgi:hypothetical protein
MNRSASAAACSISSSSGGAIGGGNNAFLPLSAAVAHCLEVRKMLEYAWGEDFGPAWSRSWLTLNDREAPIVIDCGVEALSAGAQRYSVSSLTKICW